MLQAYKNDVPTVCSTWSFQTSTASSEMNVVNNIKNVIITKTVSAISFKLSFITKGYDMAMNRAGWTCVINDRLEEDI